LVGDDLELVLVGNKLDLADSTIRQVSYEQGQELAKGNGIGKFYETSAKDGRCYSEIITESMKGVLTKMIDSSQSTVHLQDHDSNHTAVKTGKCVVC
jgi:GTPase SAR1 family protein